MDNNMNNEREWYRSAGDDRAEMSENMRKIRRSTSAWRIACIVLIVLILIAATSVISARLARAGAAEDMTGTYDDGFLWDDGSGKTQDEDADGEMPDSAEDFFDGFYQKTEDTSANVDVDIPESRYDPSFEIELLEKGDEMSLGDLYDSCSKSIVAIYGYQQDSLTNYYWGTGVVLTEDGLILTNSHVIEGCNKVTVKLADDTEYEASLVGADGISDIAVLRIEAESLEPAQFGQSGRLRVGDEVAAIGNPLGEEFRMTLTNGIISAIDRDISYKGRSMVLLQTNTALNSGNSGGALFNMSGQVIGITNMKMMSSYSSIEGIGFAIPSETVKSVVSSIVEHGKVLGRPSIGITVGAVPEQARERYSMPAGVYVTDVQENSDAAAKGIQKGDVITEVNGTPVESTAEIQAIKDALKVGDTLTVKIWRSGEIIEMEIALMETNDLY